MSAPREQGVYRTPKRECSHAKSGCCPKCYDPCGLLRSTREFRLNQSKSQVNHQPTLEGVAANG